MPRKGGIGRRRKKSKVTVTEEPTPEVEEQLEEGVEEEEPEDDDEPIDEIGIMAQNATDLLIENLITDFAVDVRVSTRWWRSRAERRSNPASPTGVFRIGKGILSKKRTTSSGMSCRISMKSLGFRRVIYAASRVRSVIVRSWGVRAAKSTRSLSGRFIRTGHRSARRSSAALAIGSCKK